MSEKRAAEGAPEIAEKKAKHAEDEEENVAEEEDIEEEENEEEGDEEEDVEGVSFYYYSKLFISYPSRILITLFYFRREKKVKMKKARKMMEKKVKRKRARRKGKETNKSCFLLWTGWDPSLILDIYFNTPITSSKVYNHQWKK